MQKSILEEAENSGFVLPPGYTIGFGGEAEQSGDSQGNLASFAPAIVLILVATLILTFRSLRMAGMLFVIAGSCVGFALLSTWSISLPIGFNMILGTLGLIGVALNDSIVVISSIRNNPDARAGNREALIKEVIGCTRHVLSTSPAPARSSRPPRPPCHRCVPPSIRRRFAFPPSLVNRLRHCSTN